VIKKIEAIIREESLAKVKKALTEIGIVGLNVSGVRGHGRQRGVEFDWKNTYSHDDLLPKVQINIVLSEHNVQRTADAIIQAARTGHEGDGIIFVYPVDDVIRISSGEKGHDALSYPGDIDERMGRTKGSG
jgi:nitrogen regulatory protein P-II 1